MLPAKAPSSPSLMRMSWKLSCTQSLNGSAWLTFRWSVKKEMIVSSAFETISMVRTSAKVITAAVEDPFRVEGLETFG
jgi:hypothetical protein